MFISCLHVPFPWYIASLKGMPEEGFCVFVQPVPQYFAFMCILRRVSEEVQFVGVFFRAIPWALREVPGGKATLPFNGLSPGA